jgi:hypothetical protein
MIRFRIQRPGIDLFNSARVFFFLLLFLLVFPKGGGKIAGVPITWGYLLLGIISCAALFRKKQKIQRFRCFYTICLIPFQFIGLMSIMINGVADVGMTISFFISFFFLPWVFLLLLSSEIDTLDMEYFSKLFKRGIFFVTCYGLFLFLWKLWIGEFLEIPFLTTNWGDFGALGEKHIDRGNVFKLISTYNNGNIFGVCLLMLLPLYCFLEKSPFRKFLVKTALLFSLSRTVWLGLAFQEICTQIFLRKQIRQSLISTLAGLSLIALTLLGIASYFKFPLWFFFDRNLGGRSEQLSFLKSASLFSTNPFSGFSEITYLGVLYAFGIIGLIAYLFSMVVPILFPLASRANLSPFHRCLALGLITYLFVSFSDGATLFIPTMAFYWFLVSLLARQSFETSPKEHPSKEDRLQAVCSTYRSWIGR